MPNTPATIAEFQQAVANVIAGVYHDLKASQELSHAFSGFGFAPKITAREGTAPVVKIDADKAHAPIPAGFKREQFTAGTLAEMDAKYFTDLREQVWNNIRNLPVPAEKVTEILSGLGYTSLPAETTSVSYTYRTPAGGKIDGRFKLAGAVPAADVKAGLLAAAKPSLTDDLTLAAFPGATGMLERITDLRITTSQVWPVYAG